MMWTMSGMGNGMVLEWNGMVSGITRTVEWRVQLNDADSGMVWTVEWRG